MNTLDEVTRWRGRTMVDAEGDKIGTIEDIYLDRHTGEPERAAVKTGLLGSKLTFAPIAEAQATGDDEVRVPFQKEHVKDAPKVEADGDLSTEEERQLYEHYGRSDYGDWQGQDRTKDADLPGDAEQPSGEPGVVGACAG